MTLWLYRLPRYHREVFGSEEPHSVYFTIMKVLDFWNMHPLRPELSTMFQVISEEKRRWFIEKFVTDIPLEGLDGVAPKTHFGILAHRSEDLARQLARDCKIHVPLLIMKGPEGYVPDGELKDRKKELKTPWEFGYVYEGHQRAGAANFLGWRSVPAFVLIRVGYDKPEVTSMTIWERDQMSIKQQELGLLDSSMVHGRKLGEWTKEQLRTFMVPRPGRTDQYNVQGLFVSDCMENHPAWGGFE